MKSADYLLLALTVAGYVALGYDVTAALPRSVLLAPHPPALTPPQPISVPTLAASEGEASARPLFWRYRRPIENPAAAGSASGALANARLSAILRQGKEIIAILELPDGTVRRLTTRPDADGWRLEALTNRVATLRRGSERLQLSLTPRPPAQTAAPSAAGAQTESGQEPPVQINKNTKNRARTEPRSPAKSSSRIERKKNTKASAANESPENTHPKNEARKLNP